MGRWPLTVCSVAYLPKHLVDDTRTKQTSIQPMKTDSAKVFRRICCSIHGGESSGRSHVGCGEPPAGLQLHSWATEAAALCSRQPSIPARTQAECTQQPRAKEVGEYGLTAQGFPTETHASPCFQRQIYLSNSEQPVGYFTTFQDRTGK